MENQAVTTDPGTQGGVPVFSGTRVPLKNLFDYLETGHTLEQFLEDFPAVNRTKAIRALEMARQALTRNAHPG